MQTSKSSVDISIIFVNWNTRELLVQCLRALPASLGDVAAEIIVVDNASTQGNLESLVDDFAGLRLLLNDSNRGFAAANNQAMQIANGRYFLLLNTDTLPGRGELQRLVEFADNHPRAGLVGVMLLNGDGSFQASYADFPSVHGETLLLLKLAERFKGAHFPFHAPQESLKPRRCDWVQGACLLAAREAIQDFGPLDEGYFMYTEETDWCARARESGWEVWYTPDVKIIHYGGQSAAHQPAAKRRQLYGSKVRFFRKHRGRAAAFTFKLIVQITSGLKLLYWALMARLRRGERGHAAQVNVQAYLTVLGLAE